MDKMVKLKIDEVEVEVPAGTLIVNAAKEVGIDIPVFCYHPKMEPVGMCRMCLVEIGRPVKDRATGEWVKEADGSLKIQFGPKLETACTTPVSEGMVVRGNTPKVAAGRKDILEFLLTSHPLDCPICDKGGECPLQNLTMGYGPGQSRFLLDEKFRLGKHVPLGELIILDRERCIQCARCIRFQDEIVDEPVISFFQRGRHLEIVTFSEPGFDSIFSGNTTDICPVGALTTVDFRFEARPWELKAAASICNHCPVGCNTTINIRREARASGDVVIKRIMPRQNEQVNEIWICDKGRFAYHYTQSIDRLVTPMLRKNGELVSASWEEALDAVAKGFQAAGKDLLALAGGRLSNEDLFNVVQVADGLKAKAGLYSTMAGGDLVAQVGAGQGTNFKDMGKETAILVVACDLHEEAPIWYLQVKQAADRGAQLISVNPRFMPLEKFARHVLRYEYGEEAAVLLALVNALSAKRPDLGEAAPEPEEMKTIRELAELVAGAQNLVIIYGSEGTDLKASQALAQACANLLIATNHTGRANNGLIPAWQVGNVQGAWDMGLRPIPDLSAIMQATRGLYLVAADPASDDPDLAEAVKAAEFVVVQDLFMTPTAMLADVVLPAMSFAEREGSYTNGLRRVQRFYPAIAARPNTQPDFAITGQIAKRLGLDLESGFPNLVMQRIAAQVPDYSAITYRKLSEVTEQWPIIGREDLYYGGTGYDNHQGLGVPLSSAAQRGEPVSLGWLQPQPLDGKPPASAGMDHGLLGMPITRLYDRGQTILPSLLLRTRVPDPFIVLNPQDAGRLELKAGDLAEVTLRGQTLTVIVRVDDTVPVGIVLLPRSMGLPVTGPEIVQVRVAVADQELTH